MFNDNANSGAGETTNDFHSYAAVRKEAIDKQSDSSWRKREGNSNEKFVKSLERFKSSRLLFRRPPVSRTQPNLRPSPQGSARSSSNVRRNFLRQKTSKRLFAIHQELMSQLVIASMCPCRVLRPQQAVLTVNLLHIYEIPAGDFRSIQTRAPFDLVLFIDEKWEVNPLWTFISIRVNKPYDIESPHRSIIVEWNEMRREIRLNLRLKFADRRVWFFQKSSRWKSSGLFTFSSFSAPHLEADLKKNAKEYFTPTSPDDEWWWLDKSFFYFNKIFSYFHGIFVFRASCLEIISFLYFEDYAKRI